jgi:hypothetical protein
VAMAEQLGGNAGRWPSEITAAASHDQKGAQSRPSKGQ